jgi:murein DD-endopeptidase MepM/ murein hydrolase activator NlpD
MKILYIIIFLVITSCTSLKQRNLPGNYHRVKAGDTLSSIGAQYKISVDEIIEVNGIENARALRVGDELFLPDSDPISTKVVSLRRAPLTKLQKNQVIIEPNLDFPVPEGKIFRAFSRAKENPYDGIGISAKRGARVIAAQKGRVLFVGDDGTKFGLIIIIEHENHIITVYTHLEKSYVKAEQIVERKAIIGNVGDSGGVSSPRLHFQVRLNERPQNPVNFIKK